MDPRRVRVLLEQVRDGAASVDDAVTALRALPFRELGHIATVDHHRALRLGFPEVVFGEGKSAEQLVLILAELLRAGGNALATRVDAQKAEVVLREIPGARYEAEARAIVVETEPFEDRGRGSIAIVSAGTSDLSVAEEAAVTARALGNRVERIYDVGVAGLHRTLARLDTLRAASVLVVVAGMEGALPSVVAGLVARPVIAVPTSIGYGASYGGLAALLGMMTTCSAGVTVVNIDNGFGAAVAAAMINRREPEA